MRRPAFRAVSISMLFALVVTAAVPVAAQFAVPTQLTTTWGADPSVSSDGNRIAYTSYDQLGISVISADGAQREFLGGIGFDPDWSWANGLIATTAGVFDPISKLRLMTWPVGINGPPAWSPTGTEIAGRKTSGGDGIWIIGYPNRTAFALPCTDGDTGCDGEGPTWSPDGQWIAFEDGAQILKVPRVGGAAETVVDGLGDPTEPAWSPDGKWIAFAMEDQDFNTHIWVADARGTAYGVKELTTGIAQDRAPAWTPGSDRIYFASDRSGRYEIWSVPFTAQAQVKVDLEPNVINLQSHAQVTAYIEPIGFDATSIDVSSVRLAGSVTPQAKFAVIGDHDRNGISDLMLKFSRSALDPLLTPGSNTLELTGSLTTGESFTGSDEIRVLVPLSAIRSDRVSPNPLNPSGVLSFTTEKPGHVVVSMFDLQGRLVRKLMDMPQSPAGRHSVAIDGRGQRGEALPSAIYYYRVDSPDGTITGRFAILK